MPEIDDSVLVAFVDRELDSDTMQMVARAVAVDPDMQETVRLLRLSTSLVKTAFSEPAYQQVTPGIVSAIMNAGVRRRYLPPRRQMMGALAASVAILVVGFGGGMLMGDRQATVVAVDDRLVDEIADYHMVYTRETERVVEVPANRRDQIEAWLGDRLHTAMRIPDLEPRGLTFAGARLLVVDNRPVAQLLYAKPGEENRPLGLSITFASRSTAPVRTESRDGVNLATWNAKGYAYVLVGSSPTSFLSDVAADLAAQLPRG